MLPSSQCKGNTSPVPVYKQPCTLLCRTSPVSASAPLSSQSRVCSWHYPYSWCSPQRQDELEVSHSPSHLWKHDSYSPGAGGERGVQPGVSREGGSYPHTSHRQGVGSPVLQRTKREGHHLLQQFLLHWGSPDQISADPKKSDVWMEEQRTTTLIYCLIITATSSRR